MYLLSVHIAPVHAAEKDFPSLANAGEDRITSVNLHSSPLMAGEEAYGLGLFEFCAGFEGVLVAAYRCQRHQAATGNKFHFRVTLFQ